MTFLKSAHCGFLNSEHLNSKQAFIFKEFFAEEFLKLFSGYQGLRSFYVFVLINVVEYDVCKLLNNNSFARRVMRASPGPNRLHWLCPAFAQQMLGGETNWSYIKARSESTVPALAS